MNLKILDIDIIFKMIKDVVLALVPISTILAVFAKSWMDNLSERKKDKQEMQHKALLNVLTLIDEVIAQKIDEKKEKSLDIVLARRYFNELLLSCENMDIIQICTQIIFEEKSEKELWESLYLVRNLIRQELGFKNIPLPQNALFLREKNWK